MDHIISSWKEGKKINIYRRSPCGLYPLDKIDKGVNYFVLALEHLGCETFYSCEGHFNKKNYTPQLYISFSCEKSVIAIIKKMLFDTITLEHNSNNEYTIRIDFDNYQDKVQKLNFLSTKWNQIIGDIIYYD